jgi:hypothetical protein
MAALVGLSRQRFMQLVKTGVFPSPLRDEATGRPYYPDEMQGVCVEVRRRNFGVNGRVVMFYVRRSASPGAKDRPRRAKPKQPVGSAAARHADILAGLHGLGLSSATPERVEQAVTELFPRGASAADTGHVIRAVFLHLKGKDSGGNVGRK